MSASMLGLPFSAACLAVGVLIGAVLTYRLADRRGWNRGWEDSHVANSATSIQLTGAEREAAMLREQLRAVGLLPEVAAPCGTAETRPYSSAGAVR